MMKSSMFLALASALLFSACEKDETTGNSTGNNNNRNDKKPTYFIRAKIDGTMYEGSYYAATIMNNTASFSCMIDYNGKKLALTASQMQYSGPKIYKDSTMTKLVLGGGAQGSYTNWHGTEPVTINVTLDNDTEVKAEFNGKIRHSDDSTIILKVTEGSLYMKWQRM